MALLNKKELGEAYDQTAFDARIARAIAEWCGRRPMPASTFVDDGEHSKVNWMAYARARLSGLEEIDAPVSFRQTTRDLSRIRRCYEDMKVMLAGRSGAIVAKRTLRPKAQVCFRPDSNIIGHDEVRADIANLKQALNA